jgi:hypothetical protein
MTIINAPKGTELSEEQKNKLSKINKIASIVLFLFGFIPLIFYLRDKEIVSMICAVVIFVAGAIYIYQSFSKRIFRM